MIQVQVLAAAHFYNAGARGMRGGADQNDKVWGLAKIGNTTVRFWGRRNGKLKFKTETGALPHELLNAKIEKGYYEVGQRRLQELCPTLEADLRSDYFSDMSRGKLNTRH
jgi:hypothetical protein